LEATQRRFIDRIAARLTDEQRSRAHSPDIDVLTAAR